MGPPNRCSALFLIVVIVLSGAGSAQSPSKPRVAVFPFDNRTTAPKDMNLETKLADDLISRITASGGFQIVDRQYLDRILAEKNLKYDPNFDSATAAKSGLLGTVDFIVAGQIDAFNSNTQDQQSSHFGVKTDQTVGTVTMRATARIISVERGTVLSAPSADTSQKKVLASGMQITIKNHTTNDAGGTKDVQQALRQLEDAATADMASKLAAKIDDVAKANEQTITPGAKSPVLVAPTSVTAVTPTSTPAPVKPKLVNVSNGMVFINKGSAAGVKAGDKFTVTRSEQTNMTDPDTGKTLVRHRTVCKLVISDVDETFSSGKCTAPNPETRSAENLPKAGDEIVPAGL
jgi:curli biogenesis system outer membrane secretion channel CsgG